MNLFTEKKGN